ncbi:MAG: hypothetical protein HKN23_11640 [Verrucomicrobiales bacterium]|nr:hypothetical protein [Verrucomicrobiales bacterium]
MKPLQSSSAGRWIIILCLALFCTITLLAVGPVMRETDQAALLRGARELSRGASSAHTGFYSYDTQFYSYWIISTFLPNPPPPVDQFQSRDLVKSGNLICALIFLIGLTAFAIRCAWVKRNPHPAVWIAFLACPAVLLCTPLAGSAIVSLGFLFLLALTASMKQSVATLFPAALLAFLSVASRADTILLMPLICWCASPSTTVSRLPAFPFIWAIATGSILALATGQWISGGTGTFFYGDFFDSKVFLAYLVFGLGSLLVVGGFLLISVGKNRELPLSFRITGILCASLPMLFYSTQLFSPRHLLTTAAAILIFACLPSRNRIPRIPGRIAIPIVALSLLPLFIGVRLPEISRPSLTLSKSTRFPTTDGLWPMGATLPFLIDLAEGDSIDHNQQIWQSAISFETAWPESDHIRILETPMREYLLLAASLRGKKATLLPVGNSLPTNANSPSVLSDLRSLNTRRPGHVRPQSTAKYDSWITNLRESGYTLITAETEISPLIVFGNEQPDGLHSEQKLARKFFGGDEFRINRVCSTNQPCSIENLAAGHRHLITASAPFQLGSKKAAPSVSGKEILYFLPVTDPSDFKSDLTSQAIDSELKIWSTTLPDYMARRFFTEK